MFGHARLFAVSWALATALIGIGPALADDERLAAQRQAIAALDFMDGFWEGTARIEWQPGQVQALRQTERVGPLLDGTLKLIEGRGYGEDGSLVFNAFAIVSWDVDRDRYRIRSYAHGYSGDYPFRALEQGFEWEIPAGEATMRFAADFSDGHWRQTGARVLPDGPAVTFIEMDLKRVGNADWQDTNTGAGR